jgi:glycoprotein endo-alpha-1,2-mannosidase
MGIIYDAHEFKTGAEFLDESVEMVFMASANTMNDYLAVYEDGYIGFVTFFPSDELGWGANHGNWEWAMRMATVRRVDFVPAVSPGFDNSLIERFNSRSVRPRKCTEYYDERWSTAILAKARTVMIHSFNSWSEGTAIEPVVERENYSLSDQNWCGKDPEAFMTRTAAWITKFRNA